MLACRPVRMGIATGNDVLYHNSIDRLVTKYSLLTDAENLCDIALDGEILASSAVLTGAAVWEYFQVGRRRRENKGKKQMTNSLSSDLGRLFGSSFSLFFSSFSSFSSFGVS